MEFARVLQWTLPLEEGQSQGQQHWDGQEEGDGGSASRKRPPVLAHGVPAKVSDDNTS